MRPGRIFLRWVAVLLGVCAFSLAGAEEKGAGQRDVAEIMVAWHLRHFYEPFTAQTKDNQKLTEADRQAMREMVEVYALYDGSRDLLGPKLFSAYSKLRDHMKGPEPEQLFVFLHFWRYDVFPGRYSSNLESYEKIVKWLRKRQEIYSPAAARCVVQIWRETYISLISSDQHARLAELDQLALDLQMEAIARGDYRPGEEYVLLEHLISDPLRLREGNYRWFEANWRKIAPRIAAAEQVHPAVKKTIAGYAALMQENYAEAERLLEEAWEFRTDLPQVPALMLKVFEESGTRGGLMELKAKQWFKRGLAADSESDILHGRYSYLMSLLKGGYEDIPFMLHLGKTFNAAPGWLASYHKFTVLRVYRQFKDMKPTEEMQAALREVMQTELRRLEAAKARGKTYDWRISMAHLVLMSWLLEDYAGGKSYAEQLGKDAFPGWDYVWFDWVGTDRERAFAECYLFGDSSLAGADYRKAMALWDAKKYQETEALLPALREKYGKVPSMEKWLKKVEERVERARR